MLEKWGGEKLEKWGGGIEFKRGEEKSLREGRKENGQSLL